MVYSLPLLGIFYKFPMGKGKLYFWFDTLVVQAAAKQTRTRTMKPQKPT